MSLLARQNCITCPTVPSTCDPVCQSNEVCTQILNTCGQCGEIKCQPIPGASSGSKTNSGAIAGGVVAVVIAILIAAGYFWYRRRSSLAAAARKRATVEVKPDVVASADAVLNRPDPLEKPPSMLSKDDARSSGLVEDPSAIHMNALSLKQPENPFSDHASIATASDRATNVIPIGLIDPSSASIALSHSTGTSSGLTPASISTGFTAPASSPPSTPRGPIRPTRAGPEIDMRLDLSRPASEAPSSILLPPTAPYAKSSKSGVSGVSSRASTISTSSSFLNEAPQIVTSKQTNFRQVLGVQRAEVVKLGSAPSSPGPSLKSHLSTSTIGKATKSPLSQAPIDATDMSASVEPSPTGSTGSGNPFSDHRATSPLSPSPSPSPSTGYGEWSPTSRPTSTMSHAESIANISTVQRVQLVKPVLPRVAEARALLAPPSPSSAGYTPQQSTYQLSPHSTPSSTPRAADFRSAGQLSPRGGEFRTAGQLSPPAQGVPRSFDDMADHRMSGSSLALTNRTSTTDSILESFPFVPPSPISLHHNASKASTPTQRSFTEQQEAAMMYEQSVAGSDTTEQGNVRPGRMTLGMSTASSGLGSFPFQINEGDGEARPPPPPGLGHDATRASLDTIQLSKDLSEFPIPGDSPTTLRNV